MEDTPRLARDWEHQSALSIEEFYKRSARRKRHILTADITLFFAGTVLACFGMF